MTTVAEKRAITAKYQAERMVVRKTYEDAKKRLEADRKAKHWELENAHKVAVKDIYDKFYLEMAETYGLEREEKATPER